MAFILIIEVLVKISLFLQCASVFVIFWRKDDEGQDSSPIKGI